MRIEQIVAAILFVGLLGWVVYEVSSDNLAEEQAGETAERIESRPHVDSVFMGYWFGMTMSTFVSHTWSLVDRGEMYFDEDGAPATDIVIDDFEGIAMPVPSFTEEGFMYKLTVILEHKPGAFSDVALLQMSFLLTVSSKYQMVLVDERECIVNRNCRCRTYEAANLRVKGSCTIDGYGLIRYIDKPLLEDVERAKEDSLRQERQKTHDKI